MNLPSPFTVPGLSPIFRRHPPFPALGSKGGSHPSPWEYSIRLLDCHFTMLWVICTYPTEPEMAACAMSDMTLMMTSIARTTGTIVTSTGMKEGVATFESRMRRQMEHYM